MTIGGKRLQYVDAVKGIAIIWVVLYHLIAPCACKTVIDHLTGLFVTAFFFFSGFFYKAGKRSFAESIQKRAGSLMIPFFRYSISFWAVGSIYLVATKNETLKEAFLCLRNFFAGCIWNRVIQDWFGWEYYSLGKRYYFLADFWFLLAMLFASILFFLIAKIALKSILSMIITALVLFLASGICLWFNVSLPYNIQLVPYWTAFMVLGAFAGSRRLMELPSVSGWIKYAVGIVALACGIVIAMLMEPATNQFRGSFGENEIASMLLCIASSLPFIFGIGILFAQIESAGIRIKELAWAGSHSMIIYLFHVFYAWIICTITGFSIRYEESVSAGVLWTSIALTVGCFALCILRSIAEDKIKEKRKCS